VYRKVITLLAVTLVLSLFAIAGELTVLASVRAPAQPLLAATGASPHAPVAEVRPEAGVAPAADGPSRLTSCKVMAAWARPLGRALAPAVAEPKISLGEVTILGQALARGEYDKRTAPTGFESVLATFPTREQAPTLILAAAMLLAIVLVATHSEPAATVEAMATARAARACAPQPSGQRRPWRPRLDPQALSLVDRTADWERVRLVPT